MKTKDDLLGALQKEIFIQQDYLPKTPIQSIYFGGGTPSLLSGDEAQQLVDTIKKYFTVQEGSEITLEANPDDLSKEKIKALRQAGINRLSIGVQSFYDDDLKWMNRAHNRQQAIQSIKDAQDEGISNITIDLIYGMPILSSERWEKNLNAAFEMNVQHLSCYSLTVEPRTALAHFIATKQINEIDDQTTSEQFQLLMDMAESNGFEQYEISNFAKHQQYSMHNSSYWRREPYLGIGPSAHSFNGRSRQWNVRNNSVYIKSINEGKIPSEREELSTDNQFNEYVMTSLRTMWGCNLETIKKDFGNISAENFFVRATNYINEGMMQQKKQNFILTKSGKFFADKIAASFFIV